MPGSAGQLRAHSRIQLCRDRRWPGADRTLGANRLTLVPGWPLSEGSTGEDRTSAVEQVRVPTEEAPLRRRVASRRRSSRSMPNFGDGLLHLREPGRSAGRSTCVSANLSPRRSKTERSVTINSDGTPRGGHHSHFVDEPRPGMLQHDEQLEGDGRDVIDATGTRETSAISTHRRVDVPMRIHSSCAYGRECAAWDAQRSSPGLPWCPSAERRGACCGSRGCTGRPPAARSRPSPSRQAGRSFAVIRQQIPSEPSCEIRLADAGKEIVDVRVATPVCQAPSG